MLNEKLINDSYSYKSFIHLQKEKKQSEYKKTPATHFMKTLNSEYNSTIQVDARICFNGKESCYLGGFLLFLAIILQIMLSV